MLKEYSDITSIIIDSAIKLHRQLGPGLLEHPYKVCLKKEIAKQGLEVESEVTMPIYYDREKIDIGYRVDLLVQRSVIVELKSISQIATIHKAQLLTYLKLANLKVGLLLNFNVLYLKDGITRIVN